MITDILYIVGSFKSGGTETQLYEILKRLDRSRYEPHVLCFEKRGGLLPHVEALGVEVRDMGIERFLSLSTPGRLRSHAAWARRRQVRIIQGFHFHGNFYGALIKRSYPEARLIACEQAIYGPEAMQHRMARSFYYRHTDIVTGNCEAVRKAVAARDGIPESRIRVIHGGVDIDRFAPGASRQGPWISADGPVIGLVGRLHPDKGQMVLLEAAPAIFAAVPTARIVLVGDGPQRKEVEARIRALGAGERVALLRDRRDVPELLTKMDILVLPSTSEGFANAALEGSAAGLPVVVSDAGGNPEIVVEGQTGFVFPLGDSRALADRVIRILSDPEAARRMGESGRRRVEESFPLSEMVRRHERLYEELLSPGAESARAPAYGDIR